MRLKWLTLTHLFIIPRLVFIGIMIPAAAFAASTDAPIADGAEKFLGNIISRRSLPSKTNFQNYWNQVTPENEGKWGYVEAQRDVMKWEWLDSMYLFAKAHNLPFKQHTFLWGKQYPTWVEKLSSEELKEEFEEWIRLFSERYPDVALIDVVNEPFHAPPPFKDSLGGAGETGWDWMIYAFTLARKYFPKATLILNEFMVISQENMAIGMYQLGLLLKSKNLIDGIGIQSHYFSIGGVPTDTIVKNLDTLARAGIPIYSTELDIRGSDSVQLADYQRVFPILWEHPCVFGITLWGWRENENWIDSSHLITSDGKERPALTWLRKYIAEHKTVTSVRLPPVNSSPASPFSELRLNGSGIHFVSSHDMVISYRVTDLMGRTILDKRSVRISRGTNLLEAKNFANGVYRISLTGGTHFKTSAMLVSNR